jgi:hypothetical protein
MEEKNIPEDEIKNEKIRIWSELKETKENKYIACALSEVNEQTKDKKLKTDHIYSIINILEFSDTRNKKEYKLIQLNDP